MSNSLKFLLDENIPDSIRKLLVSNGYESRYAEKGIKNSKLMSLAKREKCVLVTRDSDFLNEVMYPPKESFGIIVFQIHPPKAEKLVKALLLLLKAKIEFEK